MERVVLAVVILLGAVVVARWVRDRRGGPRDAPTQPRRQVPTQIDRADFTSPNASGESPTAPWAVIVFSSEACGTCAQVIAKAEVLASAEVEVRTVAFEHEPGLHRRYGIDSVPTVVVADAQGVVQFATIGPITATDLWMAVAKVRDPDLATPEGGCSAH